MYAVLIILVLLIIFWRAEGMTLTWDAPIEQKIKGTYWDGQLMHPCDECLDSKKCPRCPQFALYTAEQRSIESFEVPTLRARVPSPMDHIAEVLTQDQIDSDEYDLQSAELAQPLMYDLPPDYMSSRERHGACGPLSRSTGASHHLDIGLLGTRNDDVFDGERAVVNGGCKTAMTPAHRLLYKDVMGLEGDHKPAIDCEVISHNGYSYKQRCDAGW